MGNPETASARAAQTLDEAIEAIYRRPQGVEEPAVSVDYVMVPREVLTKLADRWLTLAAHAACFPDESATLTNCAVELQGVFAGGIDRPATDLCQPTARGPSADAELSEPGAMVLLPWEPAMPLVRSLASALNISPDNLCGCWSEFYAAWTSEIISPTPVWRCWHCDFVATNEAEANEHFGQANIGPALCQRIETYKDKFADIIAKARSPQIAAHHIALHMQALSREATADGEVG